MITADFLGISSEKMTSQFNQYTSHLQDFHIQVKGDIKFPRRVRIENSEYNWHWEWPWTSLSWDIAVILNESKFDLYCAAPDNNPLFGEFHEEGSAPFKVIFFYSDNTFETMTVDARKVFEEKEESSLISSSLSDWPESVPSYMICDTTSENDKMDRAEGVLKTFGFGVSVFNDVSDKLKGLRVLDFGCGEGHLPKVIVENGAFAVGYDITTDEVEDKDLIITKDFDKVIKNTPYDLIFLYDVLDHADDPMALLDQIRSVSKLNTIIKIRCHPWVSRHGGHLYNTFNKAFAHLILNEQELSELGVVVPATKTKILRPSTEYQEMFEKAGFKVLGSEFTKQSVETFFNRAIFKNRLGKINMKELECCFLDFELKPV